jgi:hypothetical protein
MEACMKKLVLSAVLLSFCFAPMTPLLAQPMPGEVHEEAVMHPRIAAAIHNLEDAIDYMQAAPHDFGGHKKAAIFECRRAIKELKKALAYRAHVDNPNP